MASEENTLEGAVAELGRAQAAVQTARRKLTGAVVAAYRAGEPVVSLAERSGMSVIEIRNLLVAARASRRPSR